MIRTFLFLIFFITLFNCSGAGVTILYAQSGSTDIEREKATEDVIKIIRKEFAIFLEEYRKYTSDPEDIKKEKLAMEKKIAEFIRDLEANSKDPYAAKDELDLWLKVRRMEAIEQINFEVDKKEFGVKVFFGGWAGFFLALAVVFLLLYAFNILQGIYSSIRNFILDLLGRRSSQVQDHISPASRADVMTSGSSARVKESRPPSRPASSSSSRSLVDRSMFCSVFTTLINPLIDQNAIEEVLKHQAQIDSPPYIGQLLKERGLISEDEIQKTLQKQKLCRGQNPSSSFGAHSSKVFSPRPYLPRR
ncbi:MAG: hypothetical protein ACQ9MH_05410 [Nitrospinales bacterium]